MTSKEVQNGIYPKAYEIQKHSTYAGLKSTHENFMSFATDSLYQFPILLNTTSDTKVFIPACLVTYPHTTKIDSSLSRIHALSPFKNSSIPDSSSDKTSYEAPLNSFVKTIEYKDLDTNKRKSTGLSEIQSFQRSFTPVSDSYQNLASFERDLILEIHRKYVSKAKESFYRSITPDYSQNLDKNFRIMDENFEFSQASKNPSLFCEEITEN